jgi:hypothetical protein
MQRRQANPQVATAEFTEICSACFMAVHLRK